MHVCMYVCMYTYVYISFGPDGAATGVPGRATASCPWRPRESEIINTTGSLKSLIHVYIYIYIYIIHICSILHYKLVWSYASISLSPGSTRKLPASVNKRLFPFNCLSISYVWCCVAFVFACLCCLFIYIYIYIYTQLPMNNSLYICIYTYIYTNHITV